MSHDEPRSGPRHFGVGSTVKPGVYIRLHIYGPGNEKARGDFAWYDVRDVMGTVSQELSLQMWVMVDQAIEASLGCGHAAESIRADREALWRECFVVYVLTAARNGGVEGASRRNLGPVTRLVNICPKCGLPFRTPLKPGTNYQCPNCDHIFSVLETTSGQDMAQPVEGPVEKAPAAFAVRR